MLVEELPNIDLLLSEIKSNMRRDQSDLMKIELQNVKRSVTRVQTDLAGRKSAIVVVHPQFNRVLSAEVVRLEVRTNEAHCQTRKSVDLFFRHHQVVDGPQAGW